jgi:GntR family transcriptional regulator
MIYQHINMSGINKSMPQPQLPRYYQIEQAILEMIQNNQFKPGEQLLSEAEVAQQFQVSRITAKRALDDLVRQGWAYRQQGRGTFVAQARIKEMSGFRSFTDDILSKGLKPSSQVLRFEQLACAEPEAVQLRVNPGDPVYILQRVRLADDQPVALETAYLPGRLFPNLSNFDLSESLFKVLREQYHVTPVWADAELQASSATAEIAQALGMQIGEPVLIANRLSYTDTFDIVEYVVSIYCGSRFTFYIGRQPIP